MTTLNRTFSAVALAGAIVIASLGTAWASAGGFGAKVYGARIASDGTHVAGTGGAGLVSSARLGLGTYEVIFTQKRDRCYTVVTLGRHDTAAAANGFINHVHRGGNANGFFIQTADATGSAADRDFILLTYCAQ